MEQNKTPIPQKPPFPYLNVHRWLLLGALLIGIFFDRAWQIETPTTQAASLCYSLFWALYLAVFLLFAWKRAKHNRDGWVLAGAFLILAVRGTVYAQQELFVINLIVIPCLLMLHAAVVNLDLPKGKEGGYFLAFFKGWFVWPFSALGRFFGAIASLFRTKRDGNLKKVLCGVLIAVPLVVIVGALLLNADGVMNFYFSDFFRNLKFGSFLWHLVLILIVTLLFYSFLFNAAYSRKLAAAEPAERKRIPAVTLTIVLAALLLIYAVFAYVQFAYLMGLRGLPAELTYSEYARQGFTELILVSIINLCVFGLCLARGEESKPLRVLMFALLAATLILLYSAAMRLILYTEAYGLTFMRLLPLWFMAFLLFVLLLCTVRLIKKKLHLVRIAAMGLVIWYLLLNVVNVDGLIAESILKKAQREGELSTQDYTYVVYHLSHDAEPVRKEYRDLLRDAALRE